MNVMASNLIPMLSSSPPPMDENGSFDEDDDFGDFTCAGGVKVLDSPLSSPIKSSVPSPNSPEGKSESEIKKVTWNDHPHSESDDENGDEPCDKRQSTDNTFTVKTGGTFSEKIVVFSEDVEEFNCDEDEMDFGEEKSGLSAKYAFTHSEQHDNTSQESVTDSGLCSSSQRSETSPLPPGETMFSELSPETEVEDTSEVFPDEPKALDLKSNVDMSCSRQSVDDEVVTESCDDNTTPVNEPHSLSDSLYISETIDKDEDDFQDFVTSANVSSTDVTSSKEHSKDECVSRTERCTSDDNDDFADFACARFEPNAVPTEESVGDDSFADFSQLSFEDTGATSDAGWANFASSDVSTFCDNSAAEMSNGSEQPSVGQVSRSQASQVQCLVSCAFPRPTQDEESQNSLLGAVGPILGSETSNSCRLWRHLEDLDGSISLQYQWSGSHAFHRTLQALNIDSRNVLHNSSVPLFALGLGELLQPVKLEQDQRPDPLTLTTTTSTNEQAEEGIPPAQFDWSSSGLVNPLDPSQSSSSLLDLDFFTSVESSSSASSSSGKLQNARASSLEEEFLGVDSVGASRPAVQPGREDLVQKLLLSVPASSSYISPMGQRAAGQNTQLSAQAARFLDLLPDLSFMQAKVLMFPIRGTTES